MNAADWKSELAKSNFKGYSVEQLKAMVSGLSVSLPTGTKALITYNGSVDGVPVYKSIKSLIESPTNQLPNPSNPSQLLNKFGWIGSTEAAILAGSTEFKSAMIEALRESVPSSELPDAVDAVIDGTASSRGIFDDISYRMTKEFKEMFIQLPGQAASIKFLSKAKLTDISTAQEQESSLV